MSSISLTEKLAIAGAFVAIVAMVIGTEDDPGVVVTGQEIAAKAPPTPSAIEIAPSAPVQGSGGGGGVFDSLFDWGYSGEEAPGEPRLPPPPLRMHAPPPGTPAPPAAVSR